MISITELSTVSFSDINAEGECRVYVKGDEVKLFLYVTAPEVSTFGLTIIPLIFSMKDLNTGSITKTPTKNLIFYDPKDLKKAQKTKYELKLKGSLKMTHTGTLIIKGTKLKGKYSMETVGFRLRWTPQYKLTRIG